MGTILWSTANGDTSTFLLFNYTAEQQTVQVRLSVKSAGWTQVYQLKPWETKKLSINDLIANQVPDKKGAFLPKTDTSGELQWFTNGTNRATGRMLLTNPATSLARSYSCYNVFALCQSGSLLNPQTYNLFVYGSDATFQTITASECLSMNSINCNSSQTVGQNQSFTTAWNASPNAPISVNSSSPTSISVHGTGAGSFTFNPIISDGTCSGFPSPPGNGNVQVPGALNAVSSPAVQYKTPYANGCSVNAPYGASIAITYQVLDSSPQHASVQNASMETQEQTSSLVINGNASGAGAAPTWQDIGPSTYAVDGSVVPGTTKSTNAQGQFVDAPFALCANAPITVTLTQSIRVLLNGSIYVVRNNSWSVSSTSIGHGSISNNGDINHTF